MFPRVDMLAILFELAGIYVIIRFENSRWLWLSIPLFVLAFYTKQSLVAFVAAGCLYLFIRNRKQGLVYSGLLAGAVLAIFIAANISDSREFFQAGFHLSAIGNLQRHYIGSLDIIYNPNTHPGYGCRLCLEK